MKRKGNDDDIKKGGKSLESCKMELSGQEDSSMIEQLDQALIKSQSMIAAQMQASLSDKTQSIKFKAKD